MVSDGQRSSFNQRWLFVHSFGSVQNFPAMHTVMYEEIDCGVFGLGYDLIIISCRGPLGVRLGQVSAKSCNA